MTKEQKIAKNVAKYGWRYEILDAWVLTHRIPPAEKSVFSQLKARTQTFGETIAKRLWEDHGIEGIYFPPTKSSKNAATLSKIETKVVSELKKLPSDDLKIEVIGFIKGLISKTTEVIEVNDQSESKSSEKIARKIKSIADGTHPQIPVETKKIIKQATKK